MYRYLLTRTSDPLIQCLATATIVCRSSRTCRAAARGLAAGDHLTARGFDWRESASPPLRRQCLDHGLERASAYLEIFLLAILIASALTAFSEPR